MNSDSEAARLTGLSEATVAARQEAEGHNELPLSGRRTPLRIVFEVVREPMLALLLFGGAIYLMLGEPRDAVVLFALGVVSVVITVVQEARTERVLEALRDLTSPRALVIRDGLRKRIAGRDVVRGDLLVLAEGDRVPADARLIECEDLLTDESLLTGESVPVRKVATTSAAKGDVRPGGDDLPFVFSGALVVRGGGIAEVTAIGVNSEIGKVGQSLKALETEPPRLQAETRRVVRVFALVAALVCVVAVILYALFRGSLLDAVLAGIALAMSMLPEEFPVVLTVFMAMGAWRISRARVLTRRASAIETLGSATVLCTDKTGTLTENRMTIAELRLASGQIWRADEDRSERIAGPFAALAKFGILASAPEPFDPMEKAFHQLGRDRLAPTMPTGADARELARTYGLRPDLLAMTQVWQEGDSATVAAKGAPEAIAELCHFTSAELARLHVLVGEMAQGGLRVLAIASATHPDPRSALPDSQRGFAFRFLGLVGLLDPLRPSVRDAVRDCRSAGIRVVMITGDYAATGEAIARMAGFDDLGALSGADLVGMNDVDLAACIGNVSVFARVLPEQKLRIVSALKARGEIVAMTGDGVNDAPSLKAAHIGIAMGGRGTDVAREAASIVLLDDDFGSIVKAIRLGRRIHDNLRKAMGFIFAVHVPIAGLALLPLIFGLPILLGPIQIAFLEMVIDPVCSLVFEAETEEDDVMQRPPRDPSAPLFSSRLIGWSLLQGLVAFAVVAVIFIVASLRGIPENEVRALAFFSLVIAIVGLIVVNRTFSASLLTALRRPNPALLWVLLGVGGMLALSLAWPAASNLFNFGPLHSDDLSLAFGAGLALVAALEIVKRLWHVERPGDPRWKSKGRSVSQLR